MLRNARPDISKYVCAPREINTKYSPQNNAATNVSPIHHIRYVTPDRRRNLLNANRLHRVMARVTRMIQNNIVVLKLNEAFAILRKSKTI